MKSDVARTTIAPRQTRSFRVAAATPVWALGIGRDRTLRPAARGGLSLVLTLANSSVTPSLSIRFAARAPFEGEGETVEVAPYSLRLEGDRPPVEEWPMGGGCITYP